ncbi:MAG: hypothetical protein ACYDBJ_09845 [Aggregatilineales bacterium]
MFEPIVRELETENAVGLLLAAQLGNTPSELILMLRTTILDAALGGLRPVGQYVIRLAGLVEHKIALGLFNHMAFVDSHPLLHHHNAPVMRIYVTSPATDPDGVLKQIDTTHSEMFGHWRDLRDDLNHRAEPRDLLAQGMGTLGEMPAPLAESIAQVLKANGVTCTLVEGEPKIGHCLLLAFDNSYLIARNFAVEKVSEIDQTQEVSSDDG